MLVPQPKDGYEMTLLPEQHIREAHSRIGIAVTEWRAETIAATVTSSVVLKVKSVA
jgi:hypothetical protein